MEITHQKSKIQAGVYLVLNPAMEESVLISKLEQLLPFDISAIQIWDNFQEGQDSQEFVRKIYKLCSAYNTPLLINNKWEYLKQFPLAGVHFDEIPTNFNQIKSEIGTDFIMGITCGNDLSKIEWAAHKKIDYISFCSIFPSSSSETCELVDFEIIKIARTIFKNPMFLAGGISHENMHKLSALPYDGVAVISGIMNVKNPVKALQQYHQKLQK